MTSSASPAVALRPPGATGSLRDYVRSVWEMRLFAWDSARSSVRAANSQQHLRSFWLVLEPVLTILVYWLVFGVVLDVSRGVDNFLAFITVGQIHYRMAQRALLGAGGSLLSGAPILRSMAFPRAVLPLSEVLKALASFRVEVLVMLAAVVIMGESIRLSWIVVAPLALAQLGFALGVGLALARVVHRYSDVHRLMQTVMRLVFYGSGVIWPVDRFIENETVLRLFYLNPLYAFIDLARWSVLGMPSASLGLAILSCLAWPSVTLVAGLIFFRRAEHLYAGARIVPRR